MNGDVIDGIGVGASSDSVTLNSLSVENSAVRESPTFGVLEIPLGTPTGRNILSCPAWRARNAHGILEGDAAN